MDSGAEIRGDYRYRLWRVWDATAQRLVYCMLNPSIANATADDQTVKVCIGRAKQMEFGGIEVVNLFAFIAQKPPDMKAAADPVGPENDAYLAHAAQRAGMMIAAWGDDGDYRGRSWKVIPALTKHCALHAIKLTKGGAPCHPLRLGYDLQPFVWRSKLEDAIG